MLNDVFCLGSSCEKERDKVLSPRAHATSKGRGGINPSGMKWRRIAASSDDWIVCDEADELPTGTTRPSSHDVRRASVTAP